MLGNARELPPEAADFLVENWIGDDKRGFGSLTHERLTKFLEGDCGLAADHPGVRRRANERKRDRFAAALNSASPDEQRRVLEAVLSEFPCGSAENRDREREMQIEAWIGCLEGQTRRGAGRVRIGQLVWRVVLNPLIIGWAALVAKCLS